MSRLTEIAKRVEAATKGPWSWWNSGKHGVTAIREEDAEANLFSCSGDRSADAAFIAAAREDVPYLLAEVERLRTLIRDALPWVIAESVALKHAESYEAVVARMEAELKP